MSWRPPRSTLHDTLGPDTTRVLSRRVVVAAVERGARLGVGQDVVGGGDLLELLLDLLVAWVEIRVKLLRQLAIRLLDLVGAGGPRDAQGLIGVFHRFSRDRKSVVSGKSVSVRVDLGGGRIIKKKNLQKTTIQ